MASRQWIKWDVDFYRGKSFSLFVEEQGEQMGYKYIKLACLILEKGTGGSMNPEDRQEWGFIRKEMGYKVTKEKSLDQANAEFRGLLEIMMDYELLDREMYELDGKYTSNRIKKSYTEYVGRHDGASVAGKASAAARAKKAAEEAEKDSQ